MILIMTVTSQTIVVPQTIAFDAPFSLQNGQTLPRFDLIVETYGTLNENKSNAILICHALSGTHHVAGRHHVSDKHAGWWDNMVGAGKPIDTNRFFCGWCKQFGRLCRQHRTFEFES